MYMLKRITAKILIVMMIMALLPALAGGFDLMGLWQMPSHAAEIYATQVNQVTVTDKSAIYEGDEFTLRITLNGAAQKIKITDTTNFKAVSGLTNFSASASGGESVWSLKLVSQGKANELKLTIYPIGEGVVGKYAPFDETVVIPGVQKSDSTTPVAVDVFKVTSGTVREVPAGTDVALEIPVEAINSITAKSVTATITSPKDESLFKSDKTTFTTTIDTISKTTPGVAKFRVYIQPSARSKTYEIKLQLKYANASGVIFSDDTANSYFIKVKNSNVEPTLAVVDYKTAGETLIAGKTDKLALTIENSGTIEASDIRVKLTGFDKDRVRLSNDVDTKGLDSLSGKGKASVTFNVSTAPAAKSETQEMTAEISYIDDAGKEYKTTSKIYLPIEGKDIAALELRVLNLKMPERVKAKESFEIAFDVKNVSKQDARMVEIGVEYPNATFIPKSTPKKFVRTLKAGEQQHFVFTFTSKDDALTGFYELYSTLKYNIEGGKDADAQTYKEFAGVYLEGALGLGRPKVIIQNYDFGGSNVMAGQEFQLNLDLFNTSSDESIKNIKVSLKADDGIFNPVNMSSSFFIPAIGSQETLSKMITLKTKPDATVKTYNLVITFMYEDSKGNAYDAQKNPFKEEETIAIPVSQPIRLETSEVTYPPEIFMNQPVTVSMEFFNMGKSPIYNLMLKAEGDFQVQGSNYFVGNFEAGRSDYFETTIVPGKEGEVAGKVIFQYEDANGERGVFEKELKFNVMPSAPVTPTNPDGTPIDPNMPDPNNPDGGVTPQPMANGKMVIIGILTAIGVAIGSTIIWKRRAEKRAEARWEDDDE